MKFDQKIKDSIENKISLENSELSHYNKIKYSISILNGIVSELPVYKSSELENITMFVIKIIKTLKKLLKITNGDIQYNSINHFILKYSNKYFNKELFDEFVYDVDLVNKEEVNFLVNKEEVNLIGMYYVIKYRNLNEFDLESIKFIYEKVSKNVKILLNKYFNIESKKLTIKGKQMITDTSLMKDITIKEYTDVICSEYWNDLDIYDESIIKYLLINNNNDLPIKVLNKLMNYFYKAIEMIRVHELKNACMLLMEIYKHKCLRGLVLKLLSLLYFYMFKYDECNYYINQGILLYNKKNNKFMLDYFYNLLFYIERFGNKVTLHSKIKIKVCDLDYKLNEIIENKYLIYLYIKNNEKWYNENKVRIDLYYRYCCKYLSEEDVNKKVKNFHSKGYNIVYIYEKGNKIICYDLYDKSKNELVNDYVQFINTFKNIMNRNKNILMDKTNPKIWYEKRSVLDRELRNLFKPFKINSELILIIEPKLHEIPIELFFQKNCYRIFDLSQLFNRITKEPNKECFYLLDPSNNLENTRRRIKKFIEKQGVEGVIGRALNVSEVNLLSNYKHFMYFGHGNGIKYHYKKDLSNMFVFLFGCSSVKLIYRENYESLNGITLSALRNNNLILGALWNITDVDLDRFSINLLKKPYDFNIRKYKLKCDLKYLNGFSLVIYGLPK
ncbi:CUT1 [Hepatospora eriocheir]|uniref:separase n=1 Tax=Hepatospora eriocheir TaxID=1081669 RepID=A0A1X0QLJ9_9MICR|nr:CUT1 [Hepatospora eriocheir]